jgi:hypothetical protein
MGVLLVVLLVAVVVLGFLYWTSCQELARREEEGAQLQQKFDRYLADDARLVDALWSRAQIETARVERVRQP